MTNSKDQGDNRLTKTIETARKALDEGDSELAIFILRDLPEVQARPIMHELAWHMYKEGTSRQEVEDFIKDLEAKL
jgi:hypothetical protein